MADKKVGLEVAAAAHVVVEWVKSHHREVGTAPANVIEAVEVLEQHHGVVLHTEPAGSEDAQSEAAE